eukprot:365942-Chlamydomonas_euryale.AAC.32
MQAASPCLVWRCTMCAPRRVAQGLGLGLVIACLTTELKNWHGQPFPHLVMHGGVGVCALVVFRRRRVHRVRSLRPLAEQRQTAPTSGRAPREF